MRSLHVVILRFSSIGDVVLTTSLANALYSTHGENIRISYIVNKEYSILLKGISSINSVLEVNKNESIYSISKKVKLLDSENKIDIILDLQGTLKSKLLCFMLFKFNSIQFPKSNFQRFLQVNLKMNLGDNHLQSHVENYILYFSSMFNLNKSLNFINTDLVNSLTEKQLTSICLSKNEVLTEQVYLDFKKKIGISLKELNYIVFVPVASYETKMWPIDKFLNLTSMILNNKKLNEYSIIILGGRDDSFCKKFNLFSKNVINLQGITNLLESALVMKYAKTFVSNDTGMGHIGESLGIPGTVIFGPTVEEFGFSPHLKSSRSLSVKLDCRPCSKHGNKPCKFVKQHCMEDISEQKVFESIEEIMSL